MTWDLSPGAWLLALDWAIRLAALAWIPHRTTPPAARSWLLLVFFVPLLGLPLYLLFGHPWLSRQRILRQAQASQAIRVGQAPQAALRWRRSGRMDLRNHRKLAVIDDDIAHVGSQNLAAAEFVRGHPNRELVARVRGPVVAHLEAVFASDWYLETGEVLDVSPTRPSQPERVATQLLASGPAYPFDNARDSVNALIHLAQRRLVLTTPYFVPDDALLAALRIAALSGVEVQLILSAPNNQRLTEWAQHSYYDGLLACGVRIALYRPRFLHAKHLSVDDGIALIGSINLDIRSFALNAEIGLFCYDRGVVARMREIEADYLRDAEQLSLDAWRARPTWRRSLEGVARLADSFM
ncbi:phospholipase D-like domain-containing protein [Luteimonas sp. RD2P54]|uniref:Phospholipase D-like domain-containing protein n=1 Tax=Luteimonas endophytica TaxID=3042023 RepID=A0ABT6JE43_9GAMM|nr:phospholipase D-like domain-containing protein [Luteimonas endophytica]MDH5824473.1 phospholipase D-like domain-containing protein [Luteimonas endophytica]